MSFDLDSYLSSVEALKQTVDAEGHVLHRGQLIGGLRVVSFLGRGATSEVWRVHDDNRDRDFAIKYFTDSDNHLPNARARFIAEARLLDEFRHKNIVRVYAICEEGDHPYFTMDVLHPLPEAPTEFQILHYLDGILDGLEELHSKGVIHRDIKPSNVLLDDHNNAVLTDLGIAHIDSGDLVLRIQDPGQRNLTMLGEAKALGTVGYGAPEQFSGAKATPATDIHALGVLIDHMFNHKMSYMWKFMLVRMTSTMPSFRLKSIKSVRRYLKCIDVRKTIKWLIINAVLWSLAFFVKCCMEPAWLDLPDEAVQIFHNPPRMIITMKDDAHYRQNNFNLKPILDWAKQSANTETQKFEQVFQKMFSALYRRYPITIRGDGTLKCPEITGCEVHLESGVKLITSGKYHTDKTLISEEYPPQTANATNLLMYTYFIVDKGAELSFTDNDNYPATLIEKR